MQIWQVDFYRSSLKDERGQTQWQLFICNPTGTFRFSAFCIQSAANVSWLVNQLSLIPVNVGENLPDKIQVFRPQSLGLIEAAGKHLNISVEATRRTNALKAWLQENALSSADNPTAIDKPPPLPLPENLWGEQWRFATLTAGEVGEVFSDRPIPILHLPEFLLPINLGLASTVAIPGVVIDGGRQSMRLARWLQEANPAALNYIPGDPAGLILESGLADRWVVATFTDGEVSAAAEIFTTRKSLSKGLHFLLVQPDDSGMTYSGFWLLQEEL